MSRGTRYHLLRSKRCEGSDSHQAGRNGIMAGTAQVAKMIGVLLRLLISQRIGNAEPPSSPLSTGREALAKEMAYAYPYGNTSFKR